MNTATYEIMSCHYQDYWPRIIGNCFCAYLCATVSNVLIQAKEYHVGDD